MQCLVEQLWHINLVSVSFFIITWVSSFFLKSFFVLQPFLGQASTMSGSLLFWFFASRKSGSVAKQLHSAKFTSVFPLLHEVQNQSLVHDDLLQSSHFVRTLFASLASLLQSGKSMLSNLFHPLQVIRGHVRTVSPFFTSDLAKHQQLSNSTSVFLVREQLQQSHFFIAVVLPQFFCLHLRLLRTSGIFETSVLLRQCGQRPRRGEQKIFFRGRAEVSGGSFFDETSSASSSWIFGCNTAIMCSAFSLLSSSRMFSNLCYFQVLFHRLRRCHGVL